MKQMSTFPDSMKFMYKWRPYQARVLEELEQYFDDERLHVVAAPGSGKTVLGLEVAKRLNQPTLVLAPTLAIRDQWVERMKDLFLPEHMRDYSWISTDIRNPEFFTACTYQSLHCALSGEDEPVESEEDEGGNDDDNETDTKIPNSEDIINRINNIGVKTIVLDEAHHLRAAWWQSLTFLLDNIESEMTVALTATPPYDVSMYEWERYLELCGPIDAEVSVPELVDEGNLCPHQDLVLFTTPTFVENTDIQEFREDVEQFKSDLIANQDFIKYLLNHPWYLNPDDHLEEIFDHPEVFSGMLVFLRHIGSQITKAHIQLIADSAAWIPSLDDKWIQRLLEGLLYPSGIDSRKIAPVLRPIRTRLRKIGALENRTIRFQNSSKLEKTLKRSMSKLKAIIAIVMLEQSAMKSNLRMVILTDFIRKALLPSSPDDRRPLDKMGVVPIFESIRRLNLDECKLGVLSGSLVIIPTSSVEMLENCALEEGLSSEIIKANPLLHDSEYSRISISGSDREHIVKLITKLFGKGGVTVLVGTKSLLGEGWDAPSINSLILASFVGSYMLSNQMRGRAIRTYKEQPDKTSNIWHIVCVEPNIDEPGDDYDTILRRFRAFVGVSFQEDSIENGFGRLGIPPPPFTEESIREINQRMSKIAVKRYELKSRWERSLARGAEGVRLVEQVKAKRVHLPRGFVFTNTLGTLLWQTLLILGVYLARQLPGFVINAGLPDLWLLAYLPMIGFLIFAIKFLPKAYTALRILIQNGPVKGNMQQIGEALVDSLCLTSYIKTQRDDLEVIAREDKKGEIFCHLKGASSRETSLYLQALKEVLEPIKNPRYILVRKSKFFGSIIRRDYHSVPALLGVRKDYAESFANAWSKRVGDMELIYTRTREGRMALLKARNNSLSAGFRPSTDRVSRWE